MKALVLHEYAEDEDSRESYTETFIYGYDRDKYVDHKNVGSDVIFSTKSGYFRNLDMSLITRKQWYSTPEIKTDLAGLTYYQGRTKRQVQREVKEHYKSKTTYNVYIGDGTKNENPGLSYDYMVKVPTLDKAIRLYKKSTHCTINHIVNGPRGYTNSPLMYKDPKEDYYYVEQGKCLVSGKRLSKV